MGKSSSVVVNPSLRTFTLSLTFHKFSMPWNHGHIDLVILFQMEFCHLGGKRETEKEKEKRQCTFYTGILLGKMAKVARFWGEKNLKLPNLDNTKLARILNFPFFWMIIRPSQDFYLFFLFQFHGFKSLVIFFHFLAICVKFTLKKKSLGIMDGLERW